MVVDHQTHFIVDTILTLFTCAAAGVFIYFLIVDHMDKCLLKWAERERRRESERKGIDADANAEPWRESLERQPGDDW